MTHTLNLSTDQIDNIRYALILASSSERMASRDDSETAAGAGRIALQLDKLYDVIVEQTGYPTDANPELGNIAVGDTIRYRGTFGMDPLPTEAKVTDLTLTGTPRSKYGDDVTEVTAEQVRQNRVLFGLDNSHWCYAEQVIIA